MGEESEPSKKKKWTQKEGLAYGMAIGRDLTDKFWQKRKKNPLDYTTPTWKKWIQKIPGVGWILIFIGILFLYGYLASFV